MLFRSVDIGNYEYNNNAAAGYSGWINFGTTAVNGINFINTGINSNGVNKSLYSTLTLNSGSINQTQRTVDGAHYVFLSTTGSLAGQIYTSGSSTTYAPTSDYRIKTDIEQLIDPVEKIKALKPKRFLIDGAPHKVDGFIAHEVQAVMPEAVLGEKDAVDENGNPIYQCMDQTKFIPSIVATLQSLLTRLEELESKITPP